jgi:hypothetical protein
VKRVSGAARKLARQAASLNMRRLDGEATIFQYAAKRRVRLAPADSARRISKHRATSRLRPSSVDGCRAVAGPLSLSILEQTVTASQSRATRGQDALFKTSRAMPVVTP